MQEEVFIGNVKLNFKHYAGLDLYSDGPIEKEIFDIVRKHKKEEYPEIIEKKASWPILYHLSELRSNIVEWIPMTGKEKVLEVGAGCGAITGMLSEKAGEVIACDLSRRRSEINATRNSECDNVTIHVGNFRDIEPDLPDNFDFIFLIGVFEYGQGYIGTENPYENFLTMLQKHLKANGRIVIAIENRIGLKYFAGAPEDHLGGYFDGIEGYSKDSVARTFTRNGLIRIFKKCGIKDYHFYYPYPDYKLMTSLHSDKYLPAYGELQDNVRNYDRDRLLLFNEKRAYECLINDGMYGEFANSFEVILGPGFDTVYCKYSNDRADEFKIRTDITIDKLGRKLIKKYPLTEAAEDHIFGMQDAYYALRERYRGGDLEVNDCQLDEKSRCAMFSYVNGIPLTALFDACLESDDMDSFNALFREYMRRIGYRPDYPVTDYDLIFPNILVNGPIWTIIDYEWTYGKCIPPKELAFRALYGYMLEDRSRDKLDVKALYEQIGLTDEEIKGLLSEEADFQKYVTGRRKSSVELWKSIGRTAIVPKELAGSSDTARSAEEIQVYVDEGDGYSEDDSIFPDETYDEHNEVTIDIECNDHVQNIRIDPAFACCIVTIKQVVWNDVSVEEGEAFISIHPNGSWISEDSIVFGTDDPNIEFGFADNRVDKKRENHLRVTMMTTLIPKETAVALEDSLRVTTDENEEEKGEFFRKIKKKLLSK
ncbi:MULTISPECIES: bifunctional 2-polyprenyl-6-hydroxyphenol methylase/3-demethylubiquinol 3-O-methyltransferase UbiG [unclassified Butyrivibrio]|uniref:class I SAM-dependent methyltransferase n=1 Tax=unclassified Butyrivibrio TaxID=2639466 RepID=UPI0003B626E1|nr:MULTISPECIES: class I SAM-dependent methyltransferase [unclassified Butyrivibrio]SDB46661.1 Methyltransferase domain-containing protein [Butyrivibrio sp. INlla16]